MKKYIKVERNYFNYYIQAKYYSQSKSFKGETRHLELMQLADVVIDSLNNTLIKNRLELVKLFDAFCLDDKN